jgi:acid phosphatase (class A)
LLALVSVAIGAGCASIDRQSERAAVPEIHPGILAGDLPSKALPNSLILIPAPPAVGSAALTLDENVSRKSLAVQGTSRWTLATEDANLMFLPVGSASRRRSIGARVLGRCN